MSVGNDNTPIYFAMAKLWRKGDRAAFDKKAETLGWDAIEAEKAWERASAAEAKIVRD